MTQETEQEIRVIGTVKIVARTGGVKLEETEETWWNPAPHVKDRILAEAQSLKGQEICLILQKEGSNIFKEYGVPVDEQPKVTEEDVALDHTAAGVPTGASFNPEQFAKEAVHGKTLPPPMPAPSGTDKTINRAAQLHSRAKQLELEKGTGVERARSRGHIKSLSGRDYILHAGLLDIAHELGLKGIQTEILSPSTTSPIIRATVTMAEKDNNGRWIPGTESTFQGIGDADQTNTSSTVQSALIRMAETRAINRALRFATNIGMTSLEELPPNQKEGDGQHQG